MNDFEQRIATLEQKIQTIDVERDVLFQELSELKYQLRQRHQKELRLLTEKATVTQQSYTKDKISTCLREITIHFISIVLVIIGVNPCITFIFLIENIINE